MGTCGWSDVSLQRCGRFYPPGTRTPEDRLRHYSSHFSCVEVDTSTYAIPTPAAVARWVQSVPRGFRFHFKAFGLFCSKWCPAAAVPGHVRPEVPLMAADRVTLSSLPPSATLKIWSAFNAAVLPAYETQRLGAVMFQFHLSFHPSPENKEHVRWCRQMLDPNYPMAVEFRDRAWVGEGQLPDTCRFLEELDIALVAADELRHETLQRDREQTGLPPGEERELMPVAWAVTTPALFYVRVHRREGSERVLSEEEIGAWGARLESLLRSPLKGPIYFMWGTDHEDQPILNARALAARVGQLALDWKAHLRQQPTRGSLLSFFSSGRAGGGAAATPEALLEKSGHLDARDWAAGQGPPVSRPQGAGATPHMPDRTEPSLMWKPPELLTGEPALVEESSKQPPGPQLSAGLCAAGSLSGAEEQQTEGKSQAVAGGEGGGCLLPVVAGSCPAASWQQEDGGEGAPEPPLLDGDGTTTVGVSERGACGHDQRLDSESGELLEGSGVACGAVPEDGARCGDMSEAAAVGGSARRSGPPLSLPPPKRRKQGPRGREQHTKAAAAVTLRKFFRPEPG